MEFRNPHDEAEEEKETPAQQEQGFLSAWIERLRRDRSDAVNPDVETEETEEDEEEKPSSSKRLQRMFRRLFSRMVEKDDSMPSEDAQANRTEEEVSPAPLVPAEDGTIFMGPENEPMAADVQLPELEHPTEEPEISIDHTEEDHGSKAKAPDVVRAPEEKVVFERASSSSKDSTAEKSNKPDVGAESGRGMGVVAGLVGLEFLARRRADRRLRHEISKSQQRIEKNDKAIYDIERKNRETVERLKAERPAPVVDKAPEKATSITPVVETIRTPEQPQEKPRVVIEASASPMEVQNPSSGTEGLAAVDSEPNTVEVATSKREESEPTKPDTKETDEATPLDIKTAVRKPEVVLEKVAGAAEKNIPIERHYERRHEIKDEAAQQSASVGAASIGSVITNIQAHSSPVSAPVAAASSPTSVTNDKPSMDYRAGLYKRAVVSGFWAALTILVFVGIAALSFS